ncbi:MAG TPA: hypothetical protein VG603_08145 [Chitinophagales bacterium]|nr:hypothetical protein [Chitinophagales bacterium]
MKKILSIVMLATVLALNSCSTPLDKKYNEQTLDKDMKEIVASKSVSDEDKDMLAGYIVISKIMGTNFEGKTYNDILKEAKDYAKKHPSSESTGK